MESLFIQIQLLVMVVKVVVNSSENQKNSHFRWIHMFEFLVTTTL